MSNSNEPKAEQIDRVKLRGVLTNCFNLDGLNSLCFELGVDPDDVTGETKEMKATALIYYLGQRERILELARAILAHRPTAFTWENITKQALPPIPNPHFSISVEFVNRNYELNLICGPRAPRFVLINGAPGIGKTYLLKRVKETYENINPEPWFGALLDLSSHKDMTSCLGKARSSICNEIVRQYSSPLAFNVDQGTSENEIIFQIVPLLLQQKGDILLLFDRVELLAKETTEWLLHFVYQIDQGLKKGNRSLRVMFSGRYLGNWGQPDQYALTSISLSTFTRETVRKVVEKTDEVRGRNATGDYISELTGHILQISGGHPLGIRNALEIVDELGFIIRPSLEFLFYERIFEHNGQIGKFFDICIEPIITEILEGISPVLRDVLYAMSPTRRFDTELLHSLQEQGVFQSSNYSSMWELLRALHTTRLISPPTVTNPMSSDQIMRRMLAMKMKLNEPLLYQKINKHARNVFHDRACGKEGIDIQLQFAAVLESLYHTLQLEPPQKTPKAVCRKLRGQLDEYLKIIVDPESRLRLKVALEDDDELCDLIDQRSGYGTVRGFLVLFDK